MGSWIVKGVITRASGASTTTLNTSAIDTLLNPSGWSIALTADTTIGSLALKATGPSSTNIRWVANIDTSEVMY